MKSALYTGEVRHRRFHPREHAFRYRLYQLYLDLDELPELFDRFWLWSARRPALSWFRRADYLGDGAVPLAQAVRDLVEERTSRRPEGPIRLLTHLRTFGLVVNPVSYYYCFSPDEERLETVVAEITNTPWGERYSYVLTDPDEGVSPRRPFEVGKDFHVSPFMPMEMGYSWRFGRPGDDLFVHIENHADGRRVFDATLRLERREIDGSALSGALLRHPFMTLRVLLGIYVQAARLWIKRIPFHTHPAKRSGGDGGSGELGTTGGPSGR